MDWAAGRAIVLLGRFVRLPRRRLVREIERRGGRIAASVGRADHLAVGAGAHTWIADGRLRGELARATGLGVAVLSEGALLDRLGLRCARAIPAALPLSELPRRSGLSRETVTLLALFDVIEPEAEQCSFRDLVAAREVARLLSEGVALDEVLAAAAVLRRATPDGNVQLAERRLSRLFDGRVGLAFGGTTADLTGQLHLPLNEAPPPSPDALYEAAEAAEAAGELPRAALLYRRCLHRGEDPQAMFNLANVLRDLGELVEAEIWLRRALALDPVFAEAWYNLAHLLRRKPDSAEARRCLERSVAADPTFADAVYNLAHLELVDGRFAQAAALWQRYLALDGTSEWALKARRALALCRWHLAAFDQGKALRVDDARAP